MSFDSPLHGVSAWITCFLQVTLAYLVLRTLCALVETPRVRVRLWGFFLFGTAAGFAATLASAIALRPSPPVLVSAARQSQAALQWSWILTESWARPLTALAPWFIRLYAVGLGIFLLQMLWKRLQLQFLLRSGTSPSADLALLFQTLCRELKVSGCRLKLVQNLRSPGTACWFRPCVFVPADLLPRISADRWTDILRHELIHVRDRDYLWDRLAAVACSIAWFHPAVWLAHRRLRWDRELACDQAVVSDREEIRFHYAECLTALASWWFLAEHKPPSGIAFSSAPSLLATRVRALLREPTSRSTFERVWRFSTIAAISTVTAFLLPNVGLGLYSLPVLPGIQAVRSRTPPVSKHAAQRARREVLKASTLPQQSSADQSAESQLAGILAGSNLAALPMLVEPSSKTERGATTPQVSANGLVHSGSGHAWDEGGAVGSTSGPNWRDIANTAINIGVSVMLAPDSDDGRTVR